MNSERGRWSRACWRNWSFSPTTSSSRPRRASQATKVAVTIFDGKIVYRPTISDRLSRVGGGRRFPCSIRADNVEDSMDLTTIPAPFIARIDGVTQALAANPLYRHRRRRMDGRPRDIRTRVFPALSIANFVALGMPTFWWLRGSRPIAAAGRVASDDGCGARRWGRCSCSTSRRSFPPAPMDQECRACRSSRWAIASRQYDRRPGMFPPASVAG